MDCPAPLNPEIFVAHFMREIDGLSYRQAAQAAKVEPSTMMRRCRRFDALRRDPSVRAALPALADAYRRGGASAITGQARASRRQHKRPPRGFRLVSDCVYRLHRKSPRLITAKHVTLAAAIRPAPQPEVAGEVPALGPVLAAVLDMAVRQDLGIEEIEDALNLPCRSGKIILAFAFDLFEKSAPAKEGRA